MKFGLFGIVTIYLAAFAVLSQMNQPTYLALVAGIIVVVAEGLALWGYDRRGQWHLVSGIIVGFVVLPVFTAALNLGVIINSLLFMPTALLQLDLGLRRLGERV
jgi:hypothetical protein